MTLIVFSNYIILFTAFFQRQALHVLPLHGVRGRVLESRRKKFERFFSSEFATLGPNGRWPHLKKGLHAPSWFLVTRTSFLEERTPAIGNHMSRSELVLTVKSENRGGAVWAASSDPLSTPRARFQPRAHFRLLEWLHPQRLPQTTEVPNLQELI